MLTDLNLSAVSAASLAEDELFKSQAQKLSLCLASAGVYVRTYERDLPFFSKLSLEQKQKANAHLGFYVELCREQMSEGYTLRDGSAFLWRALRKLDLVPRSDLFQLLDDDSVIEIYSKDNVQLFRNINFFKYCSYTLEELHSREWWLLFNRDAGVTDKLYEYVSSMFAGQKESVVMDVPTHSVRELESAELLEMEVDFQIMSPLTHNRTPTAFLVTEAVKIINSKSMMTT